MKGFVKKCKSALVVVLSVAMLGNSVDLSLLNVQAGNEQHTMETVSADEVEVKPAELNSVSEGDQQVYTYEEWFDVVTSETSVTPIGLFRLTDAAVSITGQPAVKWIDRLNLSQDTDGITRTIYNNLVEWSDNDGVDDYLINGEKESYAIETKTGTINTAGKTEGEIKELIGEQYPIVFANYEGYIRAAFDAFYRDYPEIFWLSGSTWVGYTCSYSTAASTTQYSMTIFMSINRNGFDMRAEGYRDASTIKSSIVQMNSLADTLVANASGKSVVDKIKYYNDRLTKINEYNTSSNLSTIGHDCRECISALEGRTGTIGPVCEAYAKAFKILCNKSGIPCVLVDGDAGGAHMWNYVQVDGNWYAVDVTWNDPKVNGVSGAVSGRENENYLLIGSGTVVPGKTQTFGESRTVQNSPSGNVSFTNGPVLSASEYMNVVAEVTTSAGVTKQYDSVAGALNSANSYTGSTIKLLKDVSWTYDPSVTNTVTIDLNGYTWDMSSNSSKIDISNWGKLTIMDSSAAQTGKILGTVSNKGSLTLKSGQIISSTSAVSNSGTFVMDGGVLEGSIGVDMDYETTFTMTGGVIQGGYCGVNVLEDSTFTMSGGTIQNCTSTTIESGHGVYNDGTFIMSGGLIQDCTTGVRGGLMTQGVVSMSGGTIKDCTYTAVLGAAEFTMTGGSISGDEYGIRACELTKLSGDVTINGGSGIDIYMFDSELISINGELTGSDTYSVKLFTTYTLDNPSIVTTGVFATGDYVDVSKFTPAAEGQEVSLASDTELQLTFKKGTLSGVVNWEDQSNQDGIRPSSVTLQLLANGTAVSGVSAVASADTQWAYSFENVDLYDANGQITYTVAPSEVTGYVASTDTYAKVTYTHGVDVRNVKAVVVWNDDDNLYMVRPESVSVKLYGNGSLVDTLVASENTNWEVSFNGLSVNEAGNAISYTLKESDYAASDYNGYTVEISGSAVDGYVITMTAAHVHVWSYSNPVVGGTVQTNVLEAHCINEDSECDLTDRNGGSLTLVVPEDVTFDHSPHRASYINTLKTGAVVEEISYSWNDGTGYMTVEEPVYAGSYHVVVPVTDKYFGTVIAEADFVIKPADMSDYVTVTPFTGVYDPSDASANTTDAVDVEVMTLASDATVTYSTDGGNTWTQAVPTLAGVGELSVKVKVVADNYNDYETEVTAVRTAFDLNNEGASINLAEGIYYYTGEQVKPEVGSIILGDGSAISLNSSDFKVTYENNTNVGENTAIVKVSGIGNCVGTISKSFTIKYIDVTPLYNGSTAVNDWYTGDVQISAEGFSVKEADGATYSPSVTITDEGKNIRKTFIFKQNETGYLSDSVEVSVNIDSIAPAFGDGQGISIGDDFWNTLLNKITFGKFFKETKTVTITATEDGSGIAEYRYYLDKSGSETVKSSEELKNCSFEVAVNGKFNITADSKYVIYAVVIDNAGNMSNYICSDGVVIDTTAPVLTVTEPAMDSNTLSDTEATFTVQVNEKASVGMYWMPYSETVTYTVEDAKALISEWKEVGAGENATLTADNLGANTKYGYIIAACDEAGNISLYAEAGDATDSYKLKAFTTTKKIPAFTTLPVISGTYGDSLSEMTITGATSSTNGATGTWTVAAEDAAVMPEVGAQNAYKVIFTPNGDNANEYEAITMEVVPVVEKRPITVTIDSKSRMFGEENPELTYAVTEGTLVGSDSLADLGVVATTNATRASNVGTYDITGVADSANYNVTVVTGTLAIEKATVEDASVSKKYLYYKENADSINLADVLPENAGAVSYQLGATDGNCTFAVAPAISGDGLSYTLNEGSVNDSASFAVTVTCENYEDFIIQVNITLVDRTPVALKSGSEVSLRDNTLTYGEALSKLSFAEAVFVVEGTNDEVAGTLAWENPEMVPDVATTKANWIFTPDSDEYMTVSGEISFIVNKAAQPAFSIVAVGDVVFTPGKVITLETVGGIDGGAVTFSTSENNGVVEVTADGIASVVGVGTATITAIKKESSGNYLDAVATYEFTVLPYELAVTEISWADGFNGVVTYNGQAHVVAVAVQVAGITLTEGTDYTVSYVNNINAYEVDENTTGFDAAKAPAVIISGMGNYVGSVSKYFVIEKMDTQITVATGKDAYNKTFGDSVFVLEGITANGDGKLTYTVSDERVIRVNADGYVTIMGAGTATITVSMPATSNCNASQDVMITVSVAKGVHQAQQIERSYAYNKNNGDAIDLSTYAVADAGAQSYQIQNVDGEVAYVTEPAVSADGKLTYTVSKGTKDQSGTIAVKVSSENYEDFVITVNISLSYEVVVVLKSGEEVTVNGELTFGEALNKLGFEDVVFVEEGTDISVEGSLAWVTPDFVPEASVSSAQWIFTPNNQDYAVVYGNTSIVVNKATQPEFKIVPLTGVIYGQDITLQAIGGLESSVVEMTVPSQNGVLSAVERDGEVFKATAIGAGKVTVSAVCKDTTGNYKDAVATYELTVAPKGLESDWADWADNFAGEETYTGEAFEPEVKVSFESATLAEGVDYTVEYVNNVNAYTVTPGDAGFEADKAPAAVIRGKGNFTGSISKYFVINRAENAPNMPEATRTVRYSVAVAGAVSLPEGWVWQNEQLALTEGGETVAVAIYNGADRGNYVNETVEVTITRMQEGIPYISEINGEGMEVIVNGWEYVSNELEAAHNGDEIVVEMNGATVLPGNILEDIAGKDVTIVLEMGSGVTWTINGSSITTDNLEDIELQVDLNTSNIPTDIVNGVIGEGYSVQMSLAHDGEFGFTALLTINLSSENVGCYAKLYYYNEESRSLEFICEDVIDSEGNAVLEFTHASDYVIVIGEEQYQEPAPEGGNSGGTTSQTPEQNDIVKSPKTGENLNSWMILLIMICVVGGIGYNMSGRSKRREE